MILTSGISCIDAHRSRKQRLMSNDASRSRAGGRVHHRAATILAAITLFGSLSDISAGIGEEIKALSSPSPGFQASSNATTYPALRAAMSYKIAMSSHPGTEKLDRDIQAAQRRVREAAEPKNFLEQLGWLYVAKARASCDQGFYKLAEQSAVALEEVDPKSSEAKLLRGHVLSCFHRFVEAEAVARELVKERTLPFDYGLLGDTLMEQGRLDDAIAAYQQMVDLRPDLQSYSRVAYLRWLKGDLEGAIEAARLAKSAVSPLDPESASWSLTRLGNYQFQAGSLGEAKAACDAALRYSPDYPAALLLQSRILLAAGRAALAVAPIQRATHKNPLSEFRWALADTLRAAGRADEAAKVEAALKGTGAQDDPRTFSLFLATRGEQVELAVELAQRELQSRADVFTHDALAWALAAAGRPEEAWPHMEKALAEGTEEARLFTHAGLLAAKLGRMAEAETWLRKARSLERMLLPSEQQQLAATLAALEERSGAGSITAAENAALSMSDQLATASQIDKSKNQENE
jgi:tetratricopeptide (TPR) repeat protein